MSSGSQIGGIIGGAIGFVVTGFNPVGFQLGYMAGSAIGGYVSPVQIKGPRLGDEAPQSVSPGGMLPFGYGRFTARGHLIWRGPLREVPKRERGKGGGTKTTTYSYFRSYAIQLCQGEIHNIIWIKRNNKKVYTTEATATAEEKSASAEFAKKLRIYRGTPDQMPDPVITAVEGVGKVSAFRDTCYFTVEQDDITDFQAAIPTYEVLIQANAPEAYLTSTPYAQFGDDSFTTGAQVTSLEVFDLLREVTQRDSTQREGLRALRGMLDTVPARSFTSSTGENFNMLGGTIAPVPAGQFGWSVVSEGVAFTGGTIDPVAQATQTSSPVAESISMKSITLS